MAFLIADGSAAGLYPGSGDTIYVPDGVAQIGPQGAVLGAAGVTQVSVVVDGALIGQQFAGISLDDDVSGFGGHRVLIGETGIVRSAVYSGFSLNGYGVSLNGSGSALENHGQISGTAGVFATNFDHGYIDNSGLISGQRSHGVFIALDSVGVEMRNSGTISGDHGVKVSASMLERLVNHGEILGGSGNGKGVDLGAANAGSLIVNRGLIAGELVSILGSSEADTIRNAGLLDGDVELGGGDDLYRGKRDGWVDGEVRGGAGADRLIGSSADDMLSGDNGHDVLRGKGGNDILTGGNGRDVFDIQLGNGDDVIMDFTSNDQVDLSDFGLSWKHLKTFDMFDGYEGLVIDLSEHGGGSVMFMELTMDGFSRADFIL